MARLSRLHSKLDRAQPEAAEPRRLKPRLRPLLTKKRRHERSCCSCREASDANYFQLRKRQSLPPSQLEYIHRNIDSEESKYKNRNYFCLPIKQSFQPLPHLYRRQGTGSGDGESPCHGSEIHDKTNGVFCLSLFAAAGTALRLAPCGHGCGSFRACGRVGSRLVVPKNPLKTPSGRRKRPKY